MRPRRSVLLLAPLLVAGLSCAKDDGAAPGDARGTAVAGTVAPAAGTAVSVGGRGRTWELDVVGDASEASTASAVAVLQRRFADADVTAEVRVAVEGRVVEIRVDEAVERGVIEGLTSRGQIRFRPVLANLPLEPVTTGSAPRRLQTSSTIDPAIQAQIEAALQQEGADLPNTPADQDVPAATVVLPEIDEATGAPTRRYRLGPAGLDGSAVEGATAGVNGITGAWEVHPIFREGSDGIDAFNRLAKTCKPESAACPTGQLAITLDGRVLSAPRIEPSAATFTPFARDTITINGSFTEQGARRLASSINAGPLPVVLRLR